MAYAFELLADKDGKGHENPTTAPPLKVVTDVPGGVGGTVPATLALTLGAGRHVRRVHARRGEGVHGDHVRQRHLHRRRRGADRHPIPAT